MGDRIRKWWHLWVLGHHPHSSFRDATGTSYICSCNLFGWHVDEP